MTVATAQGLEGAPPVGPLPRAGTSAGGPLLPGKTDDERWQLLRSQEKSLIGKTRSEIVNMFGKGGSVKGEDELVYQITQPCKRPADKLSAIAYTELHLLFVRNAVSEFTVRTVWF
jgi:hypothetical protein